MMQDDNPYAAFADDPSGVALPPDVQGDNPYAQFFADEAAPERPSSSKASAPKVSTVDNPFAQKAEKPEPLPSFPGIIVADPELHDAFTRLETSVKQKGTDALNESRGWGFIDGLMDPSQYREAAKGVIPGAIGFGATTLKGTEAAGARAQSNAAAFNRRQLEIFDRIDRGEAVPDMEDPVGYAAMTPDQRMAARAEVERAAAEFRPTPLAERPLYRAGEAVSKFGRELMPAAPGYEQSVGRQLGEGIGSLLGGLPAGFLGRIPAATVFGAAGSGEAAERAVAFDRAERAAGRPGLTQDQLTVAALWGIAPGATDLLPIETLMGRLKIPAPFSKIAARAIGRIGGQAAIEGMQESGQSFLQNLIAKEIYNPEQSLTQDVVPSGGVGAGVGGISQAAKEMAKLLIRNAAGRRGGGSVSPSPQPAPAQEEVFPGDVLPREPDVAAPVAEAMPAPSVRVTEGDAAGKDRALSTIDAYVRDFPERTSGSSPNEREASALRSLQDLGSIDLGDGLVAQVHSTSPGKFAHITISRDGDVFDNRAYFHVSNHGDRENALAVREAFVDDPELKGRGIARRVYDAVERAAKANGVSLLPTGRGDLTAEGAGFWESRLKSQGVPAQTPQEAPTAPEDKGQRGVDVIQFIRSKGGLKPSGELDAVDAKRYPGLISRKGLSADQMREAMVEAGFLQEADPEGVATTTPQDVFDLVARSIGGERIVAAADKSADDAYKAAQDRRSEERELKAAEQTFVLPEIARYDEEFGSPILRPVYDQLDAISKNEVIDRNRRGEDVADILEEMVMRRRDEPTLAAMAVKRGITKKQQAELRAMIRREQPEMLASLDALAKQLPERKERGSRAMPAAAQPDPQVTQRLQSFASLIDNRVPRKEWATQLGVSEDDLATLVEQAIAKNWLRRDRTGMITRAPKEQRSGPLVAMAVPANAPMQIPGEEGDVAYTDEGQARRAEMHDAVDLAASRILPTAVRVKVVDAIQTGRKAAEAFALRRGTGSVSLNQGDAQMAGDFDDWFAGSKVVDGKGKPLLVYRGTSNDFKAERSRFEGATFFSPSRQNAKNYADKYGKSGKVIAAYISLKNPLVANEDQTIDFWYDHPAAKGNTPKQMIESLKAAGYDGIISTARYGHKDGEVIAFYPEQIREKSPAAPSSPGTPSGGSLSLGDELLALRAFHGTPHDFDRFEWSDKTRGTGEGAQAFGDGLYFAEAEAVAKTYQVAISDNIAASDPVARLVRDVMQDARSDADAIAKLRMREEATSSADMKANYAQAIARFDELKKKLRGNLYEVSIDVEPKDLLDWDKPFGKQAQKVQDALSPLAPDGDGGWHPELPIETLYDIVVRDQGSPALSQALRDAGVPGIRFLDAVSRAAKGGTANLVIFDDSLITITKKNGEHVSSEERKDVLDEMYALRGGQSTPQILTPEFRKWFGDSKVVDGKGRPLVVYHGTESDFSAFSPEKIGSRTDSGFLGRGFYFSDDARVGDIAPSEFASGTTGAVMPVYLRMENPLRLEIPNFSTDKRKVVRAALNLQDDATSADVTSAAMAAGYDGVALSYRPTGYNATEYVVFDPTQIKSAIGNRGTFDPTDPSFINAMRRQPEPEALGQTDPYTMTISIAARAIEAEAAAKGVSAEGEAVRVLRHEAVEFFKAVGMFTDGEWKTLENAARKQGWVESTGVREAYTQLYKDGMSDAQLEDILLKEAIAEQYSEFHLGRKQFKGPIRIAFQRIKDFILRAMNALKGMGFQTWDDVFEKIDAGEFARRFEARNPMDSTGLEDVAPRTLPGDIGPDPALAPQPAGPTPGLVLSGPGSLIDIQKELRRRLGLTTAAGRMDQGMSQKAAAAGGKLMGQFNRQTEVIRLRVLQDIDTEAHEVAHALESRYPLAALQQANSNDLRHIARITGSSSIPSTLSLSEGFAEFFRLYLTNPSAAQAHAPTFLKAFENFMNARDPQTLKYIQDIRDQYQEWRNASSAGRIMAAVKSGVPETTWQEIRTEYDRGGMAKVGGLFWRWMEKVYQNRVDAANPIRKLVENIARQAEAVNQDIDLTAWRNPVMQARKIATVDNASYMDVTKGVGFANAAGRGTVSLRDALSTAFGGAQYDQWTDAQRDAFGAYLIARRGRWLWQRYGLDPAKDRGRLSAAPQNAQDGDWYFDTMSGGRKVYVSGRWENELFHAPDKHKLDDHLQTIKDLDAANPSFAFAAQEVYAFLRDLNLKRYQAGLDSKEEYDYKTGTADYVPWFRDMTDRVFAGTPVAGRKVAPKFRIKGSYRDFINPVEGIIRQVFDTNHEIAVNQPKLLMAQLADSVKGAGRYAEIIPATRMRVEEVRIREALEAAARQEGIPDQDAKQMISAVAAMIGDDAVAKIFRSDKAKDGGDAILHYMDGGELKMVQIHDDGYGIARDILGFFDMLKGTPAADGFYSLLQASVRIPQKGITSAFGFMWRNLIRDMQQSAILQAGYFPLASNIRTVMDNRSRRASGQQTWSEILARHGGIMGGIGRTDVQQIKQGRVSELRLDGVTLSPARRDFWLKTMNPWHEDFWKWAEWTEANSRQTIARISYERSIADVRASHPAMPKEQQEFIALEAAVQRSRDYTDYARGGGAPSQIALNRLLMFLNPYIQGLDKAVRSAFLAQTNEGRFAASQVLRKKIMPLFNSDYQKRDLTQNEVDALKDALRLWVTVGIIASIHLLIETLFNDPDDLEDKSSLERAMYVTFTIDGHAYHIPRGFDVLNVVSNGMRTTYASWFREDPRALKDFRDAALSNLLPPMSQPLLDLYIAYKHNKNNFFGGDIENDSLAGRMPLDRYTAYTSNLSRRVAEGVSAVAPFEASPIMVEYSATALGSDWARDILRAYDAADPQKPALKWQDMPFLRTFSASKRSRGSEDFWKLMGQDGEFMQAGNSYKAEAVEGKNWSRDEIRNFFNERLKDDDARAFAILNAHYDKKQRRLHPMERAKDFIGAINATGRDVASNQIDVDVTRKETQRAEVSRETRRQAMEILSEVSRREFRNALIALKRPGYENREPQAIDTYLKELEAISPEIYQLLMKRLTDNDGRPLVYDYSQIRREWPEVRRELLSREKREEIIDAEGQIEFKDLNYYVSGARASGIRRGSYGGFEVRP